MVRQKYGGKCCVWQYVYGKCSQEVRRCPARAVVPVSIIYEPTLDISTGWP